RIAVKGDRGPPSFGRHQIENVRTNLRRIVVPLLFPMTVDLPVRTGNAMIPGLAPVLNGFMGCPQSSVRTKMGNRRDGARGCCGPNHVVSFNEGPRQFDTNFQRERSVPVDRNMATTPHLLRAQSVPDKPTLLWNDPRQLVRSRLAADHRELDAVEVLHT